MDAESLKKINNTLKKIGVNDPVSSITLNELIEKLITFKSFYPDECNKPVYFDCLHIKGEIVSYNDFLELL